MKRMILLIICLLSISLHADIVKLKISGPIESITDEYITDSFKTINSMSEVDLVIIEIDTPGGFDTSMRSIIKIIFSSPVPVVTFISPQGARGASAGFFISISADIAAMAPGTNMGAAHPVSIFPISQPKEDEKNKKNTEKESQKNNSIMMDKVTNDAISYIKSIAKTRGRNTRWAMKAVSDSKSYTADECLENNLIDYIAADIKQLLEKLDGKEIIMLNGKKFTLSLKNKNIIEIELTFRQKFLKTITNPSLAYLLFILGIAGLYLEFTHPGAILPGIIGGICLLIAFLSFQILPINYIGLLLVLLSIGLFIAEIKIQGFGILGIGGIVSFFLGSIMLIDGPIPEMRPSMSLIAILSICFGSTILFLTYKVFQAMKKKAFSGGNAFIGRIGITKSEVSSMGGTVFINGEWWNAISEDHIKRGKQVKIISVKELLLTVAEEK